MNSHAGWKDYAADRKDTIAGWMVPLCLNPRRQSVGTDQSAELAMLLAGLLKLITPKPSD